MIIFLMLLLALPLPNAKIGMDIDEFKKIYPKTTSSTYESEITLTVKDKILKTPVEWGFRFKENRLDWIHMSHYSKDLTEKNFKHCLKMAEQLIAETEKVYGKPSTVEKGNMEFVDPYKKHHWGYDVLEARWESASGMKIKVEFTFFGGKGDYNFLVKMNVFSESYPYFD